MSPLTLLCLVVGLVAFVWWLWREETYERVQRRQAEAGSSRERHTPVTDSRNTPVAMGVNRIYNVLFLCTGNSARSIMAECALNRWGKRQFRAYSAGSHPLDRVHPRTLELLEDLKYPLDGLRSKSWDEFARPDSPTLDFVFTVCDKAAGETCPVWPGHPMTAHWGVADPAAYVGPEDKQLAFFRKIYLELETRIKLFTNLPLDSIESMSLQHRLDDIGRE